MGGEKEGDEEQWSAGKEVLVEDLLKRDGPLGGMSAGG